MDVSVIIATRNRAESLAHTLAQLARQETQGVFTYEVVIVDNGSTDQTRDVVQRLTERFPVPLRYVQEPCAGKPWAVNTGFRHAQGAVFALTDDDVRPTPTWLAGLWSCVMEERADVVAGKILPEWTGPRPAWLSDEAIRPFVFGALGCVDHGDQRLVSSVGHPYYCVGGNLALRREVVQELGGLDVRMGRGEDTEYSWRCLRAGKKLVYEPAAVVFHAIGPERLTTAYFRRWWHARGYYRAYRLPWRLHNLLMLESPRWYAESLELVLLWAGRSLTGRPWAQRFLCEVRLRERGSQWMQRARLLPAMWHAVLTKGRGILSGTVSYVDVMSGRWSGAGRRGDALA